MREAIPSWYCALVVVRRGDHFLLVHESSHGQSWYLPAGLVEPGEALVEAAQRETLEEAGIPITIEGIIRIEHTPFPSSTRVRGIFLASPADNTPPKAQPDEHSLEAAWITLADLNSLSLRHLEVRRLLEYVANGGAIYPLKLLAPEGAPLG